MRCGDDDTAVIVWVKRRRMTVKEMELTGAGVYIRVKRVGSCRRRLYFEKLLHPLEETIGDQITDAHFLQLSLHIV